MAGSNSPFVERFRVGWGDIDGNGHMANTAFLDHAADTRFRFFVHHGFSSDRFEQERVGPVIVRDELVYRKELRLAEEFTVDLNLVGLSADKVRFAIENTFRNSTGEVVAVVRSEGVWFDLDARRPRVPPTDLEAAQDELPRGESFQVIPSRRP